jgi:Holliday junction resolvase
VRAVADELGASANGVHKALKRGGQPAVPINVFTDAEVERLKREYVMYRQAGKLQQLADEMGRTKPFICRQAGKLGLTDASGPRVYASTWKHITGHAALVVWEDFKASKHGVKAYCTYRGYDDLGFARSMKEWFGAEWDAVVEAKQPKSGRYAQGRRFEYRCRDFLTERGWYVIRAPQSRGAADLVAIKDGTVLFVQCKAGTSWIGVEEWNKLYDLAVGLGVTPVVAERPLGATEISWWLMTGRKGDRGRQPREALNLDDDPELLR